MLAPVFSTSAKSFLLLAICAALMIGCARFEFRNSNVWILRQTDVNGVLTWAVLPASYNSQNPTPWIIYNHGWGQTISSILADPPQGGFVRSLAAAGFVVIASEYRNRSCWGDQECVEDIANLQTVWRSQLNLLPQPFVIGESMGGIVTWNAISHGTLKPLAAVGIYPACSLAAMFATPIFTPTVERAYDITSPAGYSTATRGFDPMLAPPTAFLDIPIQVWASYSDHSVLRSQNEDPFADAINAIGGSVTIHTSHGGHGDPTNFKAGPVISFFSSRLADANEDPVLDQGGSSRESRSRPPISMSIQRAIAPHPARPVENSVRKY
jgi:pimeloyl-ACP methyl ester carboxylesterase